MQSVYKFCRNTEIATSATHGPKEVNILAVIGSQDGTVCCDNGDLKQLIEIEGWMWWMNWPYLNKVIDG
jgi:hypothetical protein